ncbi:MAG: ATP-binding cassette domain-containing protein, partial [Boseongicola sp.]
MAIIGPSGAGKTTLARILSGALVPTAGVVRLDEIALDHWNEQDRMGATGYLAQDLNLLPASVAKNIARLETKPDDNAVVQAALFTEAHELIGTLPQGYATPIGPGGVILSGGQRQRIALARAFFGSPKFVVLDEPNAHLDEAGNRALDTTLARAKDAAITTIVVTQRKEVLNRADRIMVLNHGRIEMFGPRDGVVAELAKRSAARQKPAKVSPLTS